MRVAPLWRALALAAAALCGFVVGVPSLLREGTPVAEAARARGPRPEEPGAVPPPAKTPAEIRNLLRWCEGADPGSVPALRSAVASGDALVAGNALRALRRLEALDDETAIALLDDARPRDRKSVV